MGGGPLILPGPVGGVRRRDSPHSTQVGFQIHGVNTRDNHFISAAWAVVGFPRWAVWPQTVLPFIPIPSHQKSLTPSSAGGASSLPGERDSGGNSRSIKLSSLESPGIGSNGAGALRGGKGDGEKAREGSPEGPGESWLPSMEVPTMNTAG